MVVGIDEVGRGCLAGPVCVAAVALELPIDGLTDSKLLTRIERQRLAVIIKQQASFIGIGWASHHYIDKHGLTAALRHAAKQAVGDSSDIVKDILLDGNHNYLRDTRVKTIVGGDAIVPAISAASIIAKVARDHYMGRQAQLYPHYGFERHVGYATPGHKTVLREVGPCTIHRMSFMPLRGLVRVD